MKVDTVRLVDVDIPFDAIVALLFKAIGAFALVAAIIGFVGFLLFAALAALISS